MNRCMLVVAALLGASLLIGCSGGGGGNGNGGGMPNAIGSFQFSVEGTNFTAYLSHFTPNGQLNVMGFTTQGPAVALNLLMPTSVPVQFQLGSFGESDALAWYVALAEGERYTSVSGTCTIISLDSSRCEGTFAFVGEAPGGATVQITNGSFDVPNTSIGPTGSF
ncbi:MAG: hypothetical protein ACOC7J_01535 [Armatimonadota bacterium]